jgi:hypothetical protein
MNPTWVCNSMTPCERTQTYKRGANGTNNRCNAQMKAANSETQFGRSSLVFRPTLFTYVHQLALGAQFSRLARTAEMVAGNNKFCRPRAE